MSNTKGNDREMRRRYYDALVNENYDMEPFEVFEQRMCNPEMRRRYYDAFVSEGYDMEPFEVFEQRIGHGASKRASENIRAIATRLPGAAYGQLAAEMADSPESVMQRGRKAIEAKRQADAKDREEAARKQAAQAVQSAVQGGGESMTLTDTSGQVSRTVGKERSQAIKPEQTAQFPKQVQEVQTEKQLQPVLTRHDVKLQQMAAPLQHQRTEQGQSEPTHSASVLQQPLVQQPKEAQQQLQTNVPEKGKGGINLEMNTDTTPLEIDSVPTLRSRGMINESIMAPGEGVLQQGITMDVAKKEAERIKEEKTKEWQANNAEWRERKIREIGGMMKSWTEGEGKRRKRIEEVRLNMRLGEGGVREGLAPGQGVYKPVEERGAAVYDPEKGFVARGVGSDGGYGTNLMGVRPGEIVARYETDDDGNSRLVGMHREWVGADGNSYDSKVMADEVSREVRAMLRPEQLEDQLEDARRLREEIKKELEQKESGQYDETAFIPNYGYMPRIITAQRDSDHLRLIAAYEDADKTVRQLERENDRRKGIDHGFWSGALDIISDVRTWDFGVGDARDALTKLQWTRQMAQTPVTMPATETDDNGHVQEKGGEQTQEFATSERQRSGDMMMRAAALRQAAESSYGSNDSKMYRYGTIFGEMLPFMVDFIVTGGGYSGIKVVDKAVRVGAKKAGVSFSKVMLEKAASYGSLRAFAKAEGIAGVKALINEQLPQGAVKTLGWLGDSGIRATVMTNTVQAAKTGTGVLERKLGDVVDGPTGLQFEDSKSWGEAIKEEELDDIIENASEMSGEVLGRVAKGVGWASGVSKAAGKLKGKGIEKLNKVVGKSGSRMSRWIGTLTAEGVGEAQSKVRRIFQTASMNGTLEEIGEEYYGQLVRTMAGIDEAYTEVPVLDEYGRQVYDEQGHPVVKRINNILSGDFNGDIWVGMSLSTGLLQAFGLGGASMSYLRSRHRVRKADARGASVFGSERADEWAAYREMVDNTTNDDMATLAERIWGDVEMTQEQKRAVIDYAQTALSHRGLNLAQAAALRSDTPAGKAENLTMGPRQKGYDEYGSRQYQRIIERISEAQKAEAESILNAEGIKTQGRSAREVLEEVIGLDLKDDAVNEAAINWAQAEAMLEGSRIRYEDDIDILVDEVEGDTQRVVNKDMDKVVEVVIGDERLYVTNGSVVIERSPAGDPVIDVDTTDQMLVAVNQEGKLRTISPADISPYWSVEDPGQWQRDELERRSNGRWINDNISIGEVVTMLRGDNKETVVIGERTFLLGNDGVGIEGVEVMAGDRKFELPLSEVEAGMAEFERVMSDGILHSVRRSQEESGRAGGGNGFAREGENRKEKVTEEDPGRAGSGNGFASEENREGEGVDSAARNKSLFPDDMTVPYTDRSVEVDQYVESEGGTGAAVYVDRSAGEKAIVLAAVDDETYVGYFRVYDEEGNPTNRWSAKFMNKNGDKTTYKDMMSLAAALLPQGHELTESESVSTDGLRNLANQLKHGYELQYDEEGRIVTDEVAVNMMGHDDLGLRGYRQSERKIISTSWNEEEREAVLDRLVPYLEALGLNRDNARWKNGALFIDHPVLRKTESKKGTGTAGDGNGFMMEEGSMSIGEVESYIDELGEVEQDEKGDVVVAQWPLRGADGRIMNVNEGVNVDDVRAQLSQTLRSVGFMEHDVWVDDEDGSIWVDLPVEKKVEGQAEQSASLAGDVLQAPPIENVSVQSADSESAEPAIAVNTSASTTSDPITQQDSQVPDTQVASSISANDQSTIPSASIASEVVSETNTPPASTQTPVTQQTAPQTPTTQLPNVPQPTQDTVETEESQQPVAHSTVSGTSVVSETSDNTAESEQALQASEDSVLPQTPTVSVAPDNTANQQQAGEKPKRKKKKRQWFAEEDEERAEFLIRKIRDGLGNTYVGFPPELLAYGAELSYLAMKNGARKFADFATAMIDRLGENIRPHLKSLYSYARYTDEVKTSEWVNELASYEEVENFDVTHFQPEYEYEEDDVTSGELRPAEPGTETAARERGETAEPGTEETVEERRAEARTQNQEVRGREPEEDEVVEEDGVAGESEGIDEEKSADITESLNTVPLDDEGTPLVTSDGVTPEQAWNTWIDYYEGDESDAADSAEWNATEKREEANKLAQDKPKREKGTSESVWRRQIKEHKEKVAEAEKEAKAWEEIVKEKNRRQSNQSNKSETRPEKRGTADDVASNEPSEAATATKGTENNKVLNEGPNRPSAEVVRRWQASHKIEGYEDTVTLADGTEIEGKWVVVESGVVSPSHDPVGWGKRPGYPVDEYERTVNDRDYERDVTAQKDTEMMAHNYDGRAIDNAVVVSDEGVVLSGNGRTMAGEIAAANDTDQKYMEALKRKSRKYGINAASFENMLHPRLVFVTSEQLPYTAETMARFNQRNEKSMNATEQSVKDAKTVSDETLRRVLNIIDGYDTMEGFYGSEKAAATVLKVLGDDGVLTEKDFGAMRESDNGRLSPEGRNRIEGLLVGKVFGENPEVVRILGEHAAVRSTVVKALSEIAKNIAFGETYSLDKYISGAIELIGSARKAGYKEGARVSEFARQGSLLDEVGFDEEGAIAKLSDIARSEISQTFADMINSGKTAILRQVLTSYNKEAAAAAHGEMSMFGQETPEELLNMVLTSFGIETAHKVTDNGTNKQGNGEIDADSDTGTPGTGTQRNDETESAAPSNEESRNREKLDDETEIHSIGKGKFGNIFSNFRGMAKAAWQYLSKIKSGQAKGVFYRSEIGEIDLVWGDAPTPYTGKGLAHINRKHVLTLGDFASMEEAVEVIDDVVKNGIIVEDDKYNTVAIEKDKYRVVIARDESGNWILTAFDKDTPAKIKKKKKDAATIGTPGQPNEGAGAVTPNLSGNKVSTLFSNKQGNSLSTDKQEEDVKSSKGYIITPTIYTNKKGKTSDVWHVKFNRELTTEEKTSVTEFIKEPLEEGKKISRGWYDWKEGVYIMRSEEAAQQLGGMIENEEVQTIIPTDKREGANASPVTYNALSALEVFDNAKKNRQNEVVLVKNGDNYVTYRDDARRAGEALKMPVANEGGIPVLSLPVNELSAKQAILTFNNLGTEVVGIETGEDRNQSPSEIVKPDSPISRGNGKNQEHSEGTKLSEKIYNSRILGYALQLSAHEPFIAAIGSNKLDDSKTAWKLFVRKFIEKDITELTGDENNRMFIDKWNTDAESLVDSIIDEAVRITNKRIEKDSVRHNHDGSITHTVNEGGVEIDVTEGDFIPGVRPNIDEHKEANKKNTSNSKPTVRKPNNSEHLSEEDKQVISDTIEETVTPESKPKAELSGDSAEYQERVQQEDSLVNDIVGEIVKRTTKRETDEDVGPLTMRDVKSMAEKYNLLKDVSVTDMQEFVERAMTVLTRSTAKQWQTDPRKGYDRVVAYYNTQPSLNARDSERLIKQQYSTPTPFSYVMGQFVNAESDVKSVLEPSAGNGALTIMFDPATVHVNDIDERRLENLRTLGYGTVTAQNGLLPFNGVQVDGVLTNPPFGTVTEKIYDGIFRISSLEGQMAINALDSMKDGGRAAIIIGGNTNYRTNGSMNPKDAAFFGYLYSHYNVVDVINISGKALYARNGTGYDVRMILINGRKTGEFSRVYPPVKAKARAEQVTTFDELYNRVQDDIQQVFQMGHKPADVQSGAGSTADGGTSTPVRSGGNKPNRGTGQRPGTTGNGSGSASGSHIEQPSSGNAESRSVGVDNGDTRNAGGSDDVQRPKPATSGSNGSGSTQNDAEGSGSNGRGTASSRSHGSGERLAVRPDLTTEKVPYPNQSDNGFTLLSVVPSAQAEVLQRSLGEIGDVDQFLVDELGYSSKEELYSFLAAEQIDSVALAIHQMNKGNAFIIGDMTGVGKGRQGAALIRYGVRQGRCPIYFTQKPTLFTDNYRDLADIGSSELRPFIIASNPKDANIVDANGVVVHKLPSKKEQERVFNYIMHNGKLPKEYDYVLTTYDQIKNGTADYSQNEDGTWNTESRKLPKKSKGYTTADYNGQARRDALARLATGVGPGQGNIAILDESHTVGGDSGCGRYMQMLTSGAYGVTFLSATFAKRADNMPIYAQRTAIAEAGVNANKLIEAITKGGVTLQEIMSKQLVESGQMIRRERSFEGVTIDWLSVGEETDRKQREQFNEIANIFNSIRNFQNEFIKPIIDGMNEAAAEQGATVGQTQGTKDLGVRNTPFASKMYNLVNQLLFALKVDAVADRVIENLRNGFKPVISFTNTMESFLASAPKGVVMDEVPNFSLTLMRALDGVMKFTENDADQNSEGGQITLSQLSPEGQKAYNEVKEKIMNLSADLPISPMDAIRMKIEEAGYSVAEITGRTTQLNRTEDGRFIVEGRKDRDKKAAMRDFNSGKLDVLMINKSGSTGISLHASSKFEDQRQRVMVFAQFQSDINDEVQMRGRIDRSGQVVRGRYEYIMSTIPAEQRIQMMFKAKLKSLDANTTSSQKSKFNEMEIVDYLNKYGDEVVWEYMKEHPELSDRLGDPLKMLQDKGEDGAARTSENEDTSQKSDCAGKISRYLAFLSVEEQDEIFKEITEAYKVKIQLLDDAGENDLEITTMPLRAETKSKQLWHRGENPDSGNAFADNTYVEEVEVDVLKKPMKRTEIEDMTRKLMGDKVATATEYDQTRYGMKEGELNWGRYADTMIQEINNFFSAKADEAVEKMKEAGDKRVVKAREKAVKDAVKARAKGENSFSDHEIQSLADVVAKEAQDKEEMKQYRRREEINAIRDRIKHLLTRLRAGHIYVVPQDLKQATADMFTQTFGTFIGFKFNKSYTLGSSTAIFATLDGRRKVELALNDKSIDTIIRCTVTAVRYSPREINSISMDNWDSKVPTQTRQKRYIITGNLLQALVDTEKGEKTKGNLISFSTLEGDTRQGILMSENFKPTDLRNSVPLRSRLRQLQNGETIVSENGDVQIEKVAIGWQHRGDYELRVPKSKQRGGIYTMNSELLNLVSGRNFITKGKNMVGYVSPENIAKVVDMLSLPPFSLTVLEKSRLRESAASEEEEDIRYSVGDREETTSPLKAENPTERPTIPITSRGAADFNGIVDTKLQPFFEKVNKGDSVDPFIGRSLTPEEAIELVEAMYNEATPIPQLSLTPENWIAEFGEDRTVETPIGMVKMGENQVEKLFTKNRTEEFGMIKPTLTTPHIIVEVPSNSVGREVERETSYLFIRAFIGGNGKKKYFYKSVTVSIDGLEISISSHYDRLKRIREALEKGKLLYRFNGGAQTEHQPADVSVATSPVTEQGGDSVIAEAKLQHFFEGANKEERIGVGRAETRAQTQGTPEPEEEAYIERIEEARRVAVETGRRLGVEVRIVNREEVRGASDERMSRAEGWFDVATGEVVINAEICAMSADCAQRAAAVVLHEVVGHKGLRALVGEEHFDEFLDNVFGAASEEIRHRILEIARKQPEWDMTNPQKAIRIATEEYMAQLAERGFENMDSEEKKWWVKLREWLKRIIEGVTGIRLTIQDKELRWILNEARRVMIARANEGREGAGTEQMRATEGEIMKRALTESERDEAGATEYRYSVGPSATEKVMIRDTYDAIISSGGYQMREALQDSMLSLRRLMEEIVRAENKKAGMGREELRIEDIEGYENAYLFENRMSSATRAQQEVWLRDKMRPLYRAVGELTGNKEVELAELGQYMKAKHGLERNEYMAQREARQRVDKALTIGKILDYDETLKRTKKKDYAGLTGLTGKNSVAKATAEAEQIVTDYEVKHDTEGLWKAVREATGSTLDIMQASGWLSEQRASEIESMYNHYIPLRGWADKKLSDVYDYMNNELNRHGSIIKSAEGRQSVSDDPIAIIHQMGLDGIRQANRNRMKLRFLNFALNHRSDLLAVSQLWLVKDAATGEWISRYAQLTPDMTGEEIEEAVRQFEEQMEKLQQLEPDKVKHGRETARLPYRVENPGQEEEHRVRVRRNGEEYVITILGNPRAAQALNGLTNPDVETGAWGGILEGAMKVNRFLSDIYTTKNPDFVISNFMRDTLYSGFGTLVKEGSGYWGKYFLNWWKANPFRMGYLFDRWRTGKLENKGVQALFRQFMENGGETGYSMHADLKELKARIRKEVRRAGGGKGREALITLKAYLTQINRAVENAARFAVFRTSLEVGRSVDRAVYDAKEVSVNFNKKGSGGKMWDNRHQNTVGKLGAGIGAVGRSLYVFWNAGMQGAANFARLHKRSPKAAVTGDVALIALGLLVAWFNDLFDGDDDDKRKYMDLPPYIRRSNICLKGADSWITIPLPIEHRMLYGVGEMSYNIMSGRELMDEWQLAAQLTQAMPLDMLEGGGMSWNPLIPSVAKPLVEAGINRSWSGGKIHGESEYTKYKPNWTKAFGNTNVMIVKLSEVLNAASGGNEVDKGRVDIHPGNVEYVLKGYLGGAWTLGNQITKTIMYCMGEQEHDWSNYPLTGRVLRTPRPEETERSVEKEWRKLLEDTERVEYRVREYRKQLIREGTDTVLWNHKLLELLESDMWKRAQIVKNSRSLLRKLRENYEMMSEEQQAIADSLELAEKRRVLEIIKDMDIDESKEKK